MEQKKKKKLPRKNLKLLLWDEFLAGITAHPSRTASGLKKPLSLKMQVTELHSPQFCQILKVFWLSPFCLASSILTYPSCLRCGPMFCISETLDYLSDLSSHSGISGGPGSTPGFKPGYKNLLRDVGKHLQKLLSASDREKSIQQLKKLCSQKQHGNMAVLVQCLLAMSLTAVLINTRLMPCRGGVWFEGARYGFCTALPISMCIHQHVRSFLPHSLLHHVNIIPISLKWLRTKC